MWKKYKKKLSSLLIVTLIASLFVPQLNVIADTADVIVGDNGTIYDADYEPYIYDEDEWEYDEEDNSDVTVLSTPTNATPSDSELATPSDATPSNWEEIFKTNVFTDAGPFMPAVEIPSMARMMRTFSLRNSSTDGTDTSALQLTKKAVKKDNGSYTITLEAYTTGKVVSTTTTSPVDIVLVLDQSGSMAYNFDGNNTGVKTDRRQYAMKQAVNNFIDEVNKRYVEENSDHRVAIVTFGSDASSLMDWTFVDEAGKTVLQNEITGLPDSPSGATNVAAGMKTAETLMGDEYDYTGENTIRQKVVIVFTDGVPTTSSEFSTTVADAAVASAKNLKDSGVTVYSIGIFNGADPTELYGSEGFDRNSNGSVGSNWSDFSFWMLGDVKSYDVPAGNRFLNYLSSNFESTTDVGIKNYSYTFVGIGYHGWEITKNYSRDETGYYLTADDSSSLNNVFTQISQNISQSDETIDSTTVINDIISPYFTVPKNTSEISLYTSDYQSDRTFAERKTADEAVVSISGDTVSVTGFDFYHNFVDLNGNGRNEDDMNASGDFFGRKLIIEFTVNPKSGFLGGNNVPTNGEESGIYLKDSEEALETFDIPYVDVPIPEITVSTEDKHVYLTGSLSAEQLLKGGSVETDNEVTLDLNPMVPNYGLEEWQTEFVDIKATVPEDKSQLTTDSKYELSVIISPKSPAATEYPATAQTDNETADIYVYLPEITYKDGEVYYGDVIPGTDYLNSLQGGNIIWKHGDTLSTNVSMIGDEPKNFAFTYQPTADTSLVKNNTVVSLSDIPVSVQTVTINNIEDLIEKVSFTRNECSGNDKCPEGLDGKGHFLLHVKSCDLTITKNGGASDESYIFYITSQNAVEDMEMTIRITGNDSITIRDLPVGTYTVTEDESWSWRYSSSWKDGKDEAELNRSNPSDFVICTNEKKNDQWLNHLSTVLKNVFGKSTGQEVSGNE